MKTFKKRLSLLSLLIVLWGLFECPLPGFVFSLKIKKPAGVPFTRAVSDTNIGERGEVGIARPGIKENGESESSG